MSFLGSGRRMASLYLYVVVLPWVALGNPHTFNLIVFDVRRANWTYRYIRTLLREFFLSNSSNCGKNARRFWHQRSLSKRAIKNLKTRRIFVKWQQKVLSGKYIFLLKHCVHSFWSEKIPWGGRLPLKLSLQKTLHHHVKSVCFQLRSFPMVVKRIHWSYRNILFFSFC